MNKIRILWWIVILLFILNLTTIFTIVYHTHTEKDETESIVVDYNAPPINGKYFRQELNFNNQQMEVFRKNNRIFRQHSNRIIGEINIQKKLMFDELQVPEADINKLNNISQEIGKLHTELKEATVQFYLSLKEVANAEQKEKMKEIFTPLFIDTSMRWGGKCCNQENICN